MPLVNLSRSFISPPQFIFPRSSSPLSGSLFFCSFYCSIISLPNPSAITFFFFNWNNFGFRDKQRLNNICLLSHKSGQRRGRNSKVNLRVWWYQQAHALHPWFHVPILPWAEPLPLPLVTNWLQLFYVVSGFH